MPAGTRGSSVRRRAVLRDAWTGDAVLTLFAREAILREGGEIDSEKAVRFTSNRFLATIGEPSEVEAQIGRRYREDGLAGAFAWIAANLLPVFLRAEEKRTPKPRQP